MEDGQLYLYSESVSTDTRAGGVNPRYRFKERKYCNNILQSEYINRRSTSQKLMCASSAVRLLRVHLNRLTLVIHNGYVVYNTSLISTVTY
jgi:hypothetical protein